MCRLKWCQWWPQKLPLQYNWNCHLYHEELCTIQLIVDVYRILALCIMTSSNGNIFRVTGHLCGEFTGPRQWHGALMFALICVWINGWVNNREAGDMRRHRARYDVIVMGGCTCICISEQRHHLTMWWLGACLTSSLYLSQCCFIVA